MTSDDTAREDAGTAPAGMPRRHGQPWKEEDFREVMEACRAGCDTEEIADRVGRTLVALRGQLRRLLPAEERHLASDLVIPRLRQLDHDGQYDWLASMAQRTKSTWDVQWEVESARGERGIGALTDEEVLCLALAMLDSPVEQPEAMRRRVPTEIVRRDLGSELRWRATRAASQAAERLLARSRIADPYAYPGDWTDDPYYESREPA